MKKSDLMQKLCGRIAQGGFEWKGQEAFAVFLLEYLQNLSISSDEQYDFWQLDQFLPQLLTDAFEELRIGTDEYIAKHRDAYEKETEHCVPEILNVNIGGSGVHHRQSAIQTTLGFLMKDLTGNEYLEGRIDAYCHVQDTMLQTVFDKFLRHVYRVGMFDLINECNFKGMNGKFGSVTVLTFSMCGRTQIQFDHEDGKQSVSFMTEEGDNLAYSAGLQSIYADVHTGCAMMEEVINNWPREEESQRQMFVSNENVTLDIIAAMKETA